MHVSNGQRCILKYDRTTLNNNRTVCLYTFTSFLASSLSLSDDDSSDDDDDDALDDDPEDELDDGLPFCVG